jgi:ubiquinone/menaquinone biosynthesis C-methylase UbiE
MQETYPSADRALEATNAFYALRGFEYTPEQVRELLGVYLRSPPARGAALDLCCGDGVWAHGLKAMCPSLEVHGIDIAEAGIHKARSLLSDDAQRFVVGDAERELPWPDGTFDLILARGPGLYNQHSMDRPATIAVIEMWHRKLKPRGVMVSCFASTPELMGSYTNPLNVSLPYNRAPRLTETVDFTGGKYHHTIQSFLTPFWKAANVRVVDYRFLRNTHILESRPLT